MEQNGTGSVNWAHPSSYETLCWRNGDGYKPGACPTPDLPTIATLRCGLCNVSASSVESGSLFYCALCSFFGTDCLQTWDNGYGTCCEGGCNRRLVCRPYIASKTLLHGREPVNNEYPKYYYGSIDSASGVPVMNIMATKKYEDFMIEETPACLCYSCSLRFCSVWFNQKGDKEYVRAFYKSGATVNRPTKYGYCANEIAPGYWCWNSQEVNNPTLEVGGLTIPWFMCDAIAEEAWDKLEDPNCLTYFALAGQKYVANGPAVFCEALMTEGAIPVLYNFKSHDPFGSGSPYLYSTGESFKDNEEKLRGILSGWGKEDVKPINCLICSAIAGMSYPGIYKDDKGNTVGIVLCSYSKKQNLSESTGCRGLDEVQVGCDFSAEELNKCYLYIQEEYKDGVYHANPEVAHSVQLCVSGEGGAQPTENNSVKMVIDFSYTPGDYGNIDDPVAYGAYTLADGMCVPNTYSFNLPNGGHSSATLDGEEVDGVRIKKESEKKISVEIDIKKWLGITTEIAEHVSGTVEVNFEASMENSGISANDSKWSSFTPFESIIFEEEEEYVKHVYWPPKYI